MSQAVAEIAGERQLALDLHERMRRAARYQRRTNDAGAGASRARAVPLCAGCRQNEARYGFRVDDAPPGEDRPRTLCFSCFRIELDYRQAVAARLARGWNAEQVRLPLEETLRELTRRRRRAQIAARHALDQDQDQETTP
jgi:hypothetical protein